MTLPGTFKRNLAIGLVAAFGAVAAFATIAPTGDAGAPPEATLRIEPLSFDARELSAPLQYVREDQFQRGDTLGGFLGRLGIEDSLIARLARAPALRTLRPGTYVRADVLADGTPNSMSFMTGRDTLMRIVREGDTFRALEEQAALETRVMMKASVIRSSLFAATDAAGIPDSIAMQLADVFGGDIDFLRDLRKGDRFTVVYELYHLAGRPVRAGRLLAAEFVNQGRTHRAERHDRFRRADRLGDRPPPALRIPHRRRGAQSVLDCPARGVTAARGTVRRVPSASRAAGSAARPARERRRRVAGLGS